MNVVSLPTLHFQERTTMKGSGGTEGGLGQYAIGFGMAMLALYLVFDSVLCREGSDSSRWDSPVGLSGGSGRGFWETTSMGIVFMPFFLGVLALFYDAKQKWAWWLMWLGVAVVAIEIISRMRFRFDIKTTHFLGHADTLRRRSRDDDAVVSGTRRGGRWMQR